ncbi:MAG: hypothetical protein ACK559_30135, partial [bacterium]
MHGRDEDRLRVGRVDRPVHQAHPVGDLPVAPLVEAPPHRVVPVLLGRNRLARGLAKRALAGLAVAHRGVPGAELARVVPDAVDRMPGEDFGDHLD